jgi:transposase
MNTTRQQKHNWSCSCKQDIPGTRPLQQQDFRSVDQQRIACYKESRTQGEAALQDGRHGHPAKLREAVLQWLQAFCRTSPQTPSREVQAALQEQFGIQVSIGHLNRVRAQLGIGNHVGRLKKNSKRPVLHRKPNGKRELADSFLSPLRKKQGCCQR